MYENNLGLIAAADKLREDKGALSAYLRDRAPSAYLVYRIQLVFEIPAKVLLNDDPEDRRFFRPGPPDLGDRKYAMRSEAPAPPSAASRDDAPPGKRHHR